MDLGLSGKTFIVTGGTSGLGLATAKVLLAEGANVLVTGRSEDKFAGARDSVGPLADQLAYFAGDNADPQLPGKLKEAVMAKWGGLDGLFISVGGPKPGKAMEIDDDSWRNAFETLYLGTVRLVRDLAPLISDGGSIALVLAPSAKEVAPMVPISSGLRPGLAMLIKHFAEELGPRNIRINALLPQMFLTERAKELFADRPIPLDTLAIKRTADPMEFGRMAAVILSPVASFVTGAAIPIDGGHLKHL